MFETKQKGGIPPTGKLEQLLAKLRELAAVQKDKGAQPAGELGVVSSEPQTLADDAPLDPATAARLTEDEALVRSALGLFGIDYDALIAMDGKSVYSRAVAAQPELVKQVLGDVSPVLAALKIAVQFTPVVDFLAKYGETPEAIKASILAEKEGAPGVSSPTRKAPVGPVFSGSYGDRAVPSSPADTSLGGFFGK